MIRFAFGAVALVGLLAVGGATPALADEAQMMSTCNTYAARHLQISPSHIASVTFGGVHSNGRPVVDGNTTSGQTFQCVFNEAGTHVVNWHHSAPKECPADVSQADRYLYPDCG